MIKRRRRRNSKRRYREGGECNVIFLMNFYVFVCLFIYIHPFCVYPLMCIFIHLSVYIFPSPPPPQIPLPLHLPLLPLPPLPPLTLPSFLRVLWTQMIFTASKFIRKDQRRRDSCPPSLKL